MSKYLFVTGKLAERALEKTLSALELEGGYRVEALGISVASLMTTQFIAAHLTGVREEVVVIPGLCHGYVEPIEQACRCRVWRGPDDLKELPHFLGFSKPAPPPGKPRLRILAEIVEAPRMTLGEILQRAAYYRENGADIIDLGTNLSGEFPHLAEAVLALKREGYTVSIDSLRPQDIWTAVNAGAGMVLSINSSNIHIAADLDCTLVIIPDEDRNLQSLFANAEKLVALNKEVAIDPILPPLMLGFTEGISRYARVREQLPLIPLLMGTGNVTEMTDADSTGINAILGGIATELGVEYVLTTESSPRTRGAVKELDLARRLMHIARESGVVPKHLDDSLLTIKDPWKSSYTEAELREMQSLVKDRNYRIFAGDGAIYIFEAHTFLRCPDAQSLFEQLPVPDPAHAFYLGRELYKAELALQLGKNYVQDSGLRWGYLSKA